MLLFFKNVTNKVVDMDNYQKDEFVDALPIEDNPESDVDHIEVQQVGLHSDLCHFPASLTLFVGNSESCI